METLEAIWAVLTALWNTGNRWARIAIAVIVLWPLLLIVVAMAGIPALTSFLALAPIAAILLLIFAFFDPLLIAAVATFPQGRKILRWIVMLISVELIIGVYCSVVPVWNDRGLIPLAFLVAVVLLLLSFFAGVFGQRVLKVTIYILLLLFVLLTAIFFLGGRENVAQKTKNFYQTVMVEKPKLVCAPQEKIVHFYPGKPTNTGLVAQLGDTIWYMEPTAPFIVPGKEKWHEITATTEHESTGIGTVVIYGNVEEGYVQIKIIPKNT